MFFGDIVNKIRKERPTKSEAPSHWIKCESCQALMYFKEIAAKRYVCPKCGYHMRLSVEDRIEILCDEGSFVEMDRELSPVDPLDFVDKKSYKKRVEEGEKKTGRASSAVGGNCTINGVAAEVVIFDFGFMG